MKKKRKFHWDVFSINKKCVYFLIKRNDKITITLIKRNDKILLFFVEVKKINRKKKVFS